MIKMDTRLFLTGLIIGLSLFAGCISDESGAEITQIAKALPMVQEFLGEHPNAEIKVALWNSDVVEGNIVEIRESCGQQMEAKSYWKVIVTEGNLDLEVWIDESTQQVVCAFKRGVGEPTTTLTSTTPATTTPTTVPMTIEATLSPTTVPTTILTTVPTTLPPTTIPTTILTTVPTTTPRRQITIAHGDFIVGEEVSILAADEDNKELLRDTDIDIYLNGVKIFSQLTNEFGIVSFTPTQPGTYIITADKSGYRDGEIEVILTSITVPTTTIGSGQKGRLNLYRSGNKTNNPVKVSVADRWTVDPIEEAEIKIYYNGLKILTKLTDSSGDVEFIPTGPGDYIITAYKSGYHEEEMQFIVTE